MHSELSEAPRPIAKALRTTSSLTETELRSSSQIRQSGSVTRQWRAVMTSPKLLLRSPAYCSGFTLIEIRFGLCLFKMLETSEADKFDLAGAIIGSRTAPPAASGTDMIEIYLAGLILFIASVGNLIAARQERRSPKREAESIGEETLATIKKALALHNGGNREEA